MCHRQSILFGTVIVALAAPSAKVLSQGLALQGPKVYSSPQAVFDAFRDAREKQDWQAIFSCLTPKLRDDEVFEAFFACAMQPSNPRIVEVLTKHGVELKAIQVEYDRQYKAKHGIGTPRPLSKRQKAEPNETPKQTPEPETPPATAAVPSPPGSPDPWAAVPPTDADILRQVICAAVKNKPAFCGDVNRVVGNGERPAPIGKLEQLRAQGDKAVGLAKTVLYHYESARGKRLQKVGQEMSLTFGFSRANGSWLIESEEAEAAR